MSEPQLQLTLIGPWQAFDPADPLTATRFDQVRRDLDDLGWLRTPEPPGARLALAATMIDDRDADGDPLFASVFVHERPRRRPVVMTDDDTIVPWRSESIADIAWPAPDIATVRICRLSYEIPLPGTERSYSITFATPNVTRWPELQYVFDAIAGTALWVDPSV